MDKAIENSYNNSLFIDRGYLRLVEMEESGCLDHGLKIKTLFRWAGRSRTRLKRPSGNRCVLGEKPLARIVSIMI